MAVLGAFAGVFVFLYLGMLGGRAAGQLVLGGLPVTVAAAVVATIGGVIALSRRRTGLGVAALAISGFGLLIGIGGVVLDAKLREANRERFRVMDEL